MCCVLCPNAQVVLTGHGGGGVDMGLLRMTPPLAPQGVQRPQKFCLQAVHAPLSHQLTLHSVAHVCAAADVSWCAAVASTSVNNCLVSSPCYCNPASQVYSLCSCRPSCKVQTTEDKQQDVTRRHMKGQNMYGRILGRGCVAENEAETCAHIGQVSQSCPTLRWYQALV